MVDDVYYGIVSRCYSVGFVLHVYIRVPVLRSAYLHLCSYFLFFFFLGVVVRNCLNWTTVILTTMIVRRNHFFGQR